MGWKYWLTVACVWGLATIVAVALVTVISASAGVAFLIGMPFGLAGVWGGMALAEYWFGE